ncbi:hypothetical protein E5Q_06413 [Mixia osmundae IAM 14324]|uniref:Cellobiose dehydrogenase cytochrome domain-containing protein n=1 Tax=Mixia osmundae (strain CBS 9802 / IAM 14324 / JCM 22182 / KY 12970) TaxID=764103 RepID=G7EA50_MIXOS|nr:hypothetical protein E5Q_06413 [Mixia osmundae IAM 14324]
MMLVLAILIGLLSIVKAAAHNAVHQLVQREPVSYCGYQIKLAGAPFVSGFAVAQDSSSKLFAIVNIGDGGQVGISPIGVIASDGSLYTEMSFIGSDFTVTIHLWAKPDGTVSSFRMSQAKIRGQNPDMNDLDNYGLACNGINIGKWQPTQ